MDTRAVGKDLTARLLFDKDERYWGGAEREPATFESWQFFIKQEMIMQTFVLQRQRSV